MYTVEMDITDSGVSSGLDWDTLNNNGIENGSGDVADADDITFTGSGDQSLPVQMSNMYATAAAKEGVTVHWQTRCEVDCEGFHVWRSVGDQGNSVQLTTTMIRGQGNSSEAHEYSYLDRDVERGRLYKYQIEEISTTGKSAFHGPIRAEGVQVIPTEFLLSQNYPNPFNPQTTMDFDLPNDSEVNIRIYNITGELVKEMVNEVMPAGYHKLVWNGRNEMGVDVTAGIYIVHMNAKNYRSVKKINLLR